MTREEVRDQLQQVLEVIVGMTAMLALDVTSAPVVELIRDELDEVLREVLPDAIELLGEVIGIDVEPAVLPDDVKPRYCGNLGVHDPHDWSIITQWDPPEHYRCRGLGQGLSDA